MIELLTCLCCSLVVIVLALSAIFSAVAACAVQLKLDCCCNRKAASAERR